MYCRYSDLYLDVEDEARRTYLGMVTAMDYAVGEVVAALKETNMLVTQTSTYKSCLFCTQV